MFIDKSAVIFDFNCYKETVSANVASCFGDSISLWNMVTARMTLAFDGPIHFNRLPVYDNVNLQLIITAVNFDTHLQQKI